MADLSEIDLDGPDSKQEVLAETEAEDTDISDEYDYYDNEARHNKTEDLHLYFEQDWRTKLGTTGLVLIAFFSVMLLMTTAILLFSYTNPGREFLQTLIFYLF